MTTSPSSSSQSSHGRERSAEPIRPSSEKDSLRAIIRTPGAGAPGYRGCALGRCQMQDHGLEPARFHDDAAGGRTRRLIGAGRERVPARLQPGAKAPVARLERADAAMRRALAYDHGGLDAPAPAAPGADAGTDGRAVPARRRRTPSRRPRVWAPIRSTTARTSVRGRDIRARIVPRTPMGRPGFEPSAPRGGTTASAIQRRSLG